MHKALLSFLLLLVFCSCQSQKKADTTKTKRSIYLNQAIPEDKAIVSIFQDSKNNYWFGTNGNGVFLYDGSSVTEYSENEGLCNNDIIEIQEDNLGNIYFDSSNGVCKFDGTTFTKIELASIPLQLHEWKLEENDLWFRLGWSHEGPFRYDGEKLFQLTFPRTSRIDEFYKLHPKASYSPTGIYEIYKDNKGHIWFGTAEAGIYRFDGENLEWMYEKHLSTTPAGGSFGIRSIIEDKDGLFWICNNNHRFNFSAEHASKKDKNYLGYQKQEGIKLQGEDANETPYFLSASKDKQDNLWFTTYDEGVYHYDGNKLYHYNLDNIGKPLLRGILVDNNDDVWIGTQSSGIIKLTNQEFKKVSF